MRRIEACNQSANIHNKGAVEFIAIMESFHGTSAYCSQLATKMLIKQCIELS